MAAPACLVTHLALLFGVVFCNNVTYSGMLTADCVKVYHRLFLSEQVPPRDYHYFHETFASHNQMRSGPPAGPGNTDVEIQWRIIGGNQISIQEAPYQVLYGRYCGGTLIAPEWVITAAHCKEKEVFILAGSTQRSQATAYPICAHFTHPLWNTSRLHSHDYDYQLVLLERPVPVTAGSRPIAIGALGDARPGRLVAVSGWGHTKYKQRKMQDYLRRVHIPIISREECRSLPLPNYKTVTPRMFCAGMPDGTKDSCQGDSGGPAVVDGKLVGLVSFGVGCAERNQPGVYSNIPMARDWIRSVTGLPL